MQSSHGYALEVRLLCLVILEPILMYEQLERLRPLLLLRMSQHLVCPDRHQPCPCLPQLRHHTGNAQGTTRAYATTRIFMPKVQRNCHHEAIRSIRTEGPGQIHLRCYIPNYT